MVDEDRKIREDESMDVALCDATQLKCGLKITPHACARGWELPL